MKPWDALADEGTIAKTIEALKQNGVLTRITPMTKSQKQIYTDDDGDLMIKNTASLAEIRKFLGLEPKK